MSKAYHLPPENLSWVLRDLRVLWHPCTQMKDHEWLPLIPIRRGEGVWLEDFAGKRYLDAISSWWVNLFGHANPVINQAIKAQLDTLEHVLLAGFSHEPAILLAEELCQYAPQGLTRLFYADGGSSAVEVALKMSYHNCYNRGEKQRTRFITLANSYHGETLGALSVGDIALYKKIYHPLLMEAIVVPSPDCFYREEGETCYHYSLRRFEDMAKAIDHHHSEICAVIVEPLVQCAGGMRMYDPIYLTQLRKLCDHYGIHLIADEIAVGFGRTGTFFACEQAGISPDFLCVGKGLTGGYLPLAAVLTREAIYQSFYDDYANMTAFLHSHSYTGNPLACRAALATLALFRQNDVLQHNQTLAASMAEATQHLSFHPHVAEIRQRGMILAIDIVQDKKNRIPYPWELRKGLAVYQHALSRGVLLRPLGNVIYFMPPYVITPQEIEWLSRIAEEAIYEATLT